MTRTEDGSRTSLRTRLARPAIAVLAAALTALGGLAVTPAPAQAGQDVVVNPSPDQKQPRILNGRVYGIDSSGPLVVVGGSFDKIRNGAFNSPDQTRQWLFMFNSTTGQIVSGFAPELRGPAPNTSGLVGDRPGVQSVQFAADGQSVYVAGDFTEVNGESRKRIVQLALDGSIISSFNASANNVVNDMALVGDRLIVSGRFGQLNNLPVTRLGSLDPTTGAIQTDFNLPATESRYEYASYIQEIDASDDGKWLAVAGNFEKIGTVTRKQLALVSLSGTPSVANWSTDSYAEDCHPDYDDSWIRGIDISPDSSYMVVSGTGAHKNADSLCDSAARWELPPTQSGDGLQPTWRNLTGGDTFWANEITDAAVYVGGHQRWVNNPVPSPRGDNDGPGAVERFGIVALDPLTGLPLSWNPERDRGRGAEAIHATDTQLFIGNDTDYFAGEIRQRLAVLGVAGGTVNPQPVSVELPVNLNFTVGNELRRVAFDGATLGTTATVSSPGADGIDWSSLRDGFVQNAKVHYFGGSNAFFSRPFSNTVIGAETNLSVAADYADTNSGLTQYGQPYGVAETDVATYHNGRIYYVKTGNSRLFSRGYSLESGILDAREEVASGRNFADARALDYIGGWLYAAWADGSLYRFPAPDGKVQYDNRQLVDNGTSGINWSQVGGLFSTAGTGEAVPPTSTPLTCDTTSPWTADYWSNKTLTGAPDVTRCEATVGENYGSGGPSGTGVGSNNFSARWASTFTTATAKSVKVDVTSDDGVRVYVDGERVIDQWRDQAATSYSGISSELAPGEHTIRVEYYESTGDAVITAGYTLVDPAPVDPGPDNIPADTTVTTPGVHEVLGSTAVTITGGATDDRFVNEVRVAILNRDESVNRWLQADGTFGPNYKTRDAVLATPGGTSTTWSLDLTLPEGSFAVDAVAVDLKGNIDRSSAYRPFKVSTTAVDSERPTVTVTSPANRETVTTSTVTAKGTATDNVGVNLVRVAVYNRDGDASTRWLQSDGTWGPNYDSKFASLATPGAASTTWSVPITLPDGKYAFDVRARDAAGNETTPSFFAPFTVNTVASDTVAPTVQVITPERNSQQTSSPITATGTASDDQGVTAVRVAVYNRIDAANRWLQPNGTWGPSYNFYEATLATPGATTTEWSIPLTLPTGSYAVDVKSQDAKGNLSTSDYRPFTVQIADAAAPRTAVKSAPSGTTAARSVQIQGVATDNQAVRKVQVQVLQKVVKKKTKRNGTVKKKVVKRYLRANGRWGRKAAFIDTVIAEDLSTRTEWAVKMKLPKKAAKTRYIVKVRAIDANANNDRTPAKAKFVTRGR